MECCSKEMEEDDKTAKKDILKKGDLVRIVEGTGNKARSHRAENGLARIHRVIPPSSPTQNHKYDVDWILGGRLLNLTREEMIYTTALHEGLTEESSRMRRKRKPSAILMEKKKDDDDDDCLNESKKKTKKSNVPSSKKKSIPLSTTKKKASSSSVMNSKTRKKTAKRTDDPENDDVGAEKLVVEQQPTRQSSAGLDLYERHRREFERSLERLERVDHFGFFLGPPPPEFDEVYDDDADGQNSSAYSKPPFNFTIIRKRMSRHRYILDRIEVVRRRRQAIHQMLSQDDRWTIPMMNEDWKPRNTQRVNWELFREDVIAMCDAAISRDPKGTKGGSGTLGHASQKIKDITEQIFLRAGQRQIEEIENDDILSQFDHLIDANKEAAVQTKWRTAPFAERRYERLTSSDVLCCGLSKSDRSSAELELLTELPDSFVGLPYSYDDMGVSSEEWMKSVGGAMMRMGDDDRRKRGKKCEENREEVAAAALESDDGVVRAQVRTTMEGLLIAVQDRVMTEMELLKQPELRSANWEEDPSTNDNNDTNNDDEKQADVSEQPVWGIDCYTRRNVILCLESDFGVEYSTEFVEKWLLPAINSCPVDLAHDITCAARILEGFPPSSSSSTPSNPTLLGKAFADKVQRQKPPWLPPAARRLRLCVKALGQSAFRIHPKGHGAVVLRRNGIPANTFATFYRGEVYPSWRWGEKLDAIEETQAKLDLRPALPDFYNMVLERPTTDPTGYALLFVDASRKAGLGSSFSHSCSPTCEVRVAAVEGKLALAMTTVRDVSQGEELTFDYNAVTESVNEYLSAVCLCGYAKCRGSFLHFATADCYQQVMARNSPIAVRFASLAKAAAKQIMSKEDIKILESHGFGTAAFGALSFSSSSSDETRRRGNDLLRNIPVWLQTFVADALRYIEYERRALPVALLCNHFSKHETPSSSSSSSNLNASSLQEKEKGDIRKDKSSNFNKRVKTTKERDRERDANSMELCNNEKQPDDDDDEKADSDSSSDDENDTIQKHPQTELEIPPASDKPIPGSKPLTSFNYFSKTNRSYFKTKLSAELKGMQTTTPVAGAVRKLAAKEWNELDERNKNYWKNLAIRDWEKNGGREKAKLERERKHRMNNNDEEQKKKGGDTKGKKKKKKKKKMIVSKKGDTKHETIKAKSQMKHKKKKKKQTTHSTTTATTTHTNNTDMKTDDNDNTNNDNNNNNPNTTFQKTSHHPSSAKISFEAADAEGRSSMEQRIQSLTQTLSRVGRILARHFETTNQTNTKEEEERRRRLRRRHDIRAPLKVLEDRAVVEWMWKNPNGIVQTLLRNASFEPCVSPALYQGLKAIFVKYEGRLTCAKQEREEELRHHRGSARKFLKRALLDFRRCILTALKMGEEDVKEAEAREKRRRMQERKRKKKEEEAKAKREEEFKRQEEAKRKEDEKQNKTKLMTAALHSSFNPQCVPFGDTKRTVNEPTQAAVNGAVMSSTATSDTETVNDSSSSCSSSSSADLCPSRPQTTVVVSSPVDEKENGKHSTTKAESCPSECSFSFQNSSSSSTSSSPDESNDEREMMEHHQKYLIHSFSRNDGAEDDDEMEENEMEDIVSNPVVSSERMSRECHGDSSSAQVTASDSLPIEPSSDQIMSSNHVSTTLEESMNGVCEDTIPVKPFEAPESNEVVAPDDDIPEEENTTTRPSSPLCSTSLSWAEYNKHKYKLEAAADVLLLYAHTSTFFTIKPYCTIESTPIEVYARELGNAVPRRLVEQKGKQQTATLTKQHEIMENEGSTIPECNNARLNGKKSSSNDSSTPTPNDNTKNDEYCEPDDVVATIIRQYSGEYVFSQLLQWYNGGIGTKSNLPELLGCVLLPSMSSCWTEKDPTTTTTTDASNSDKRKRKNNVFLNYKNDIQPLLVKWLDDRYSRGNPWPETLSQFFSGSSTTSRDERRFASEEDDKENAETATTSSAELEILALGSPITDLLVTGDDSNLRLISNALQDRTNYSSTDIATLEKQESVAAAAAAATRMVNGRMSSSTAERLQVTVDEGMPAQAVANWVQCEACLKWRKLPWHVDVDLLPDKFYCKDMKWNADGMNSCDVPEDVYRDG